MTDLYSITTVNTSGPNFRAAITFNPDHAVFAGHFPGQPVVPGVVLIEIATAAVSQATGKSLVMKEASVLKFLKMIDPRERSVILLDCYIVENEGKIMADLKFYHADNEFAKFKGMVFVVSQSDAK